MPTVLLLVDSMWKLELELKLNRYVQIKHRMNISEENAANEWVNERNPKRVRIIAYFKNNRKQSASTAAIQII